MAPRLTVVYRVRGQASAMPARADVLAVEQSVEMPVEGIGDPRVREEVVGQVLRIEQVSDGLHDIHIGLAVETVGEDAGQLLNMVFGNSSLHDDVILQDLDVPDDLARVFGGPRYGIAGLRRRLGRSDRALTASALKPQGLGPEQLADIAVRLALGGIDVVKDDHGLGDRRPAPFADRVRAVAVALRAVAESTGHRTCYAPNLSGDLERCHRQVELVRAEGLDTVMIAPMLLGLSNVQALVRQHPDIAFLAHPTMAGAARIAPRVLYGRIFRLMGADGVIFPNYGGRFGYSPETCRGLTDAARAHWRGLTSSLPIPAGGMTPRRVPELIDFYGRDVMLLIGGALLTARDGLTRETADFTRLVLSSGEGDVR